VLVLSSVTTTDTVGQSRVHFPISGAGCELNREGDGVVTTTYWELSNQTEVCVRLAPESTPPRSVILYLVAVYDGRQATGHPISILCRVQSSGIAGPDQILKSKLSVKGDGFALDLTAPDRKYELTYPCPSSSDGCSFNGVIALLEPSELAALSMVEQAGGTALGVPFTFTAAQLAIIRSFATRIGTAGWL
jgi:hypothetical protein